MLRFAKESGSYLYSFWNPNEVNKSRLEEALANLLKAPLFKQDPAQTSTEWENLYNWFEKLTKEVPSSDPGSIIFNYLSKQSFSAIDQNEFWINFGLTRQFPMGNEFWPADQKAEFISYFHVLNAENKINKNTLSEYFRHGVTDDESTRAGFEFWVKVLYAHWDEKIDNAFSYYLRIYRGYLPNKQAIENTLKYSLAWNNYHALEGLLTTMLQSYQQTYSYVTGNSMQQIVANYKLSSDEGPKRTVLNVIIDHANTYNNPKFLEIVNKVLPGVKIDLEKKFNVYSPY